MEPEAVGDTAIVVTEANQENGADTQFQTQVQSDVVNKAEVVSDTDVTPGTVIQVQSDGVNKAEAVSDTDVTPGTVIQVQNDVVGKPEAVSDTD